MGGRARGIVKMRQPMGRTETASNRGILRPARGAAPLRAHARPPAPDLDPWVERHWMVEWDLDAPFTQELLNHPTINLAVEPGSPALRHPHRARPQSSAAPAGSSA